MVANMVGAYRIVGAASASLKKMPLKGVVFDCGVAFKPIWAEMEQVKLDGSAKETVAAMNKRQVKDTLRQGAYVAEKAIRELDEEDLRLALERQIGADMELRGQSSGLESCVSASTAAGKTVASVGIMPHNDSVEKLQRRDAKFKWTPRNNGLPHLLKYLKTRMIHWGVILEHEMRPEYVWGFDYEMMKLLTQRPEGTDNKRPTVAELRENLKEIVDRMGLERQSVMVVSDDKDMLTAAMRQDMIRCAFEPDDPMPDSYSLRVQNPYEIQREVEAFNGVSHIASFSGTSVIGGGRSHGYGYGSAMDGRKTTRGPTQSHAYLRK